MSARILIIRHGETDWNREERIQGQRDQPLNAAGREQARRLGRRLQGEPVAAVYTSDLVRAAETARIAFEGQDVPIVADRDLRERHYGEWEGLTWPEIQAKFPGARRGRNAAPPGGEEWAAMQARFVAATARIARDHAGRMVAVVTHGGPCKAILLDLFGQPPDRRFLFETSNASLSVWEISDARRRLHLYNSTEHLDGIAEPRREEGAYEL